MTGDGSRFCFTKGVAVKSRQDFLVVVVNMHRTIRAQPAATVLDELFAVRRCMSLPPFSRNWLSTGRGQEVAWPASSQKIWSTSEIPHASDESPNTENFLGI